VVMAQHAIAEPLTPEQLAIIIARIEGLTVRVDAIAERLEAVDEFADYNAVRIGEMEDESHGRGPCHECQELGPPGSAQRARVIAETFSGKKGA
jgi:hypothetical protein